MEDFIRKFREQLMDPDDNSVTAETKFRDLDDWDSLTAMAEISMIEDEYGVKIADEQFKLFNTVGDIFHFINTQNKD